MQVRSRLLDFALRLRDEVGDVADDQLKPGIPGTGNASGLFANAVFGDSTTIIVGNNNVQHVNSHNKAGDLEDLLATLRNAGVAEQDLAALAAALGEDGPTTDKNRFGPNVAEWVSKQFGRAANAAWNVELGIAGGLLTTALQNYYGLGS
jgi:hypothetical protein